MAMQHSLRILSRKKYFTPTIIALTAHAMEGTEIKCLNAGMKKMLTKPISMGQLKMCWKTSKKKI
jgi:CheY-like chemotaxis protein